jgi:hypothetical protein
VGRFLQEDPIGLAGGDENIYNYAFSNPLNFTDSSGLVIDVFADIGFILFDVAQLIIGDPCKQEENLAALGGDVIGALTPGLTGVGLGIRGVNAAKKFSRFERQLERQLVKDGPKSLQKTLKSLKRRLFEHQEKLDNLKFKSSVAREIKNFKKQIRETERFIKARGL